jgi:predicted DNA-binding ribbon-helix-helix protein
MKSLVVKRSVAIDGHKTSVSLEDAFWKGLKEIADNRSQTLSEVVSTIDTDRRLGNLSSAIRVFVLHHFRNENKRMDVAKAHLSTVGAETTPASQP